MLIFKAFLPVVPVAIKENAINPDKCFETGEIEN